MNRPEWYLGNVKAVQNRRWNERDKLAVFALREEENIPAQEVAGMYGVSRTQIYNVTRLVRRSKSKQCFSCGNPLTPKERKKKGLVKACDKCKKEKQEYKNKRRKEFLKSGICPYCEKRKIVKGKKSCKKCLSATHRRRYNVGLCGQCGRRSIADHSEALCHTCLRINRKRSEALRKLNRLAKAGRKNAQLGKKLAKSRYR